ncbi:MAG: HEAT repeat protein [Methanosaeta sp. PtaB.Bin018]|nr:MAG: HEAT repeat protein [Methanosaeta sp. PtaB.Bin018]
MDDSKGLEVLLSTHKDHRIRLFAARSLGRACRGCSSRALVRALDDPIPSVRHAAISALGRTGDYEALEALRKPLKGRSCYTRGLAARAWLEISGLPSSKMENLELLMDLLCSGDEHVKKAILDIGESAVDFLTKKLKADSYPTRQQAAQTLALHFRDLLDRSPPGEYPFRTSAVSAQDIASLYSFRIIRKGGIVDKVENSGFDAISKTLCGRDGAVQLSLFRHSRPQLTKRANEAESEDDIVSYDLDELLSKHGAKFWRRMGRTLVASFGHGCVAIKLCRDAGDRKKLLAEARMQKFLKGFGISSHLPVPQGSLIKVDGLPPALRSAIGISELEPHGICYTAKRDYFVYLGDPRLSTEGLRKGMITCAHDLAHLVRCGLIHTSLIPLSHRRGLEGGDDVYRWSRKLAGRLEDWQESCRYPNLRLSGIADLEHINVYEKISSQELFEHAGLHLLSMSLVLGCYFRSRGSFKRDELSSLMKGSFHEYYRAFTCQETSTLDCCIAWEDLADRMAEEMGGEKHRNIDENHLGRLNGPFPLPELIRAIHLTSLFSVLELQAQNR